ncbi:uncharacterized protein ACDP82_005085 [Pangshura tecta]
MQDWTLRVLQKSDQHPEDPVYMKQVYRSSDSGGRRKKKTCLYQENEDFLDRRQDQLQRAQCSEDSEQATQRGEKAIEDNWQHVTSRIGKSTRKVHVPETQMQVGKLEGLYVLQSSCGPGSGRRETKRSIKQVLNRLSQDPQMSLPSLKEIMETFWRMVQGADQHHSKTTDFHPVHDQTEIAYILGTQSCKHLSMGATSLIWVVPWN